MQMKSDLILWRRRVIILQGIYYFLTGLWPLIHINSFMVVTGPKTDIWLVKMVGLLTIAVAINLFYLNRSGEVKLLAITSALSYLLIDVYYASNGTISGVYLADAAIELVIILLVLFL